MSKVHLRKYGVQATVTFDLYEVDGVDLRVDAVHAAGDTKIMKDEGVEANTTNGFTDEGNGYSIVLTATEMQAARIVVYVIDQTATKVWLDRTIVIETYGNASAQHAMDLDDSVRGGLTALPNAAADAAGGLPVSDAGGLDLDNLGADTDTLLTRLVGTIAAGTHNAQSGDAFARLGAPVGASISADLAVVDGNVDTLLTRITSTLFAGITSLAQWLGLIAGKQVGNATARTELRATGAGAGTFDETTDSQEAIRDTAPLGTAMRGTDGAYTGTPPTEAAIADAVWDEATAGHVGVGSFGAEVQSHALSSEISALNDPTAAAIAAAVWNALQASHTTVGTFGEIATEMAQVLADTGTDGVPLTAAAVDSILDEVVDGTYTLRQLLRGFASAMLAKASGLDTTAAVFRDLADTKPRISATVDASGNRTAVTLDLT